VGNVLPWRRPAAVEASAVPARRRLTVLPRSPSGTILEVSDVAGLTEAVSRETALTIPAVAACRNLIVGCAVQLTVFRYRGDERLEPGSLITRPDPSTVWPATLAGTIDELMFYGRAYWRILERDAEGYPSRARWTPVADVTPEASPTGGSYSTLDGYRVAGEDRIVPVADVIRFDSPLPGVLQTGGRTLASALELEAAARRLAAVELPAGVLDNQGTELSDLEAEELVARFQGMRQTYGIAFTQGVTYSRENLSPADLQLIEARSNAATDVARLFNTSVAMISASPSGGASALLYSNLQQQLALFLATAVQPHLVTVEATLSELAYPRGQSIAFDAQRYLRSDPQAAADYAIGLWQADLISRDEARSFIGLPASTAAPTLTPGGI
jgi:phage portal protein BeeE